LMPERWSSCKSLEIWRSFDASPSAQPSARLSER
jgi:hypothetical protein